MTKLEEVIALLKELQPAMELDEGTDLFDTGYIDSFVIFNELLPKIESKYGFEVTPLDLMPENFLTPGAIANFIETKIG